ncbi:MAG: hypothetical protein FDZ70_07025 [Actinobacteria bacterium]|nr:MAG: hypothetical protein FDZ70_07025 [Actinomycetota bacterium]
MGWLWALLAVLVALVVGVQFAYLHSTAGLKGSGVARIIRAVNLALVMVAVALAVYAVLATAPAGGR